jgi:hypothetical protein
VATGDERYAVGAKRTPRSRDPERAGKDQFRLANCPGAQDSLSMIQSDPLRHAVGFVLQENNKKENDTSQCGVPKNHRPQESVTQHGGYQVS